ncbi:histidine phosphatase family protein [Glaciimonas sp. GNP009]
MTKIAATLLFLFFCTNVLADETIVFIRHGEKPESEFGQLNCQGLNRSLALPANLINKFGKPDAIFAPNPNPTALQKESGKIFFYVRPLATIEPTAVRLGLPINLQFGIKDSADLQAALLSPNYKNAVIFVAWEHTWAQKIVQSLVESMDKNEAAKVPLWDRGDFDSIYVVRITGEAADRRVTFSLDKQGLNGLPNSCPVN